MLSRWLADVALDQDNLGGVPAYVTPNVMRGAGVLSGMLPTAIWDDVTILLPWALYYSTGDKRVLKAQYSSMKTYLEAVPRNSAANSRLWLPHLFQWGVSHIFIMCTTSRLTFEGLA